MTRAICLLALLLPITAFAGPITKIEFNGVITLTQRGSDPADNFPDVPAGATFHGEIGVGYCQVFKTPYGTQYSSPADYAFVQFDAPYSEVQDGAAGDNSVMTLDGSPSKGYIFSVGSIIYPWAFDSEFEFQYGSGINTFLLQGANFDPETDWVRYEGRITQFHVTTPDTGTTAGLLFGSVLLLGLCKKYCART